MKQGTNLHRVIECLQQQQKMTQLKPQGQDIEQIHNVTINLLNTFGDQIDRCKRYNQARIHRKYQSTILLLEQQNITLKRQLQLERESVPSSQKYVSDLIDRMVDLRNANDQLRKHYESIQSQLSLYERKEDQIKRRENSTVQSSEISNQSLLLRDAISKFTKLKKRQGNHKEERSLLRFLQFNSAKSAKWTIIEMLQRLDKWIGSIKDTRFIDSQRVRQNFERTQSSIDQNPLVFNIGQTTRADAIRVTESSHVGEPSTRLIKLKTQNMGNFVNERFTIIRKKPRQAIHLSQLRKQGRTKSQTNGAKK